MRENESKENLLVWWHHPTYNAILYPIPSSKLDSFYEVCAYFDVKQDGKAYWLNSLGGTTGSDITALFEDYTEYPVDEKEDLYWDSQDLVSVVIPKEQTILSRRFFKYFDGQEREATIRLGQLPGISQMAHCFHFGSSVEVAVVIRCWEEGLPEFHQESFLTFK